MKRNPSESGMLRLHSRQFQQKRISNLRRLDQRSGSTSCPAQCRHRSSHGPLMRLDVRTRWRRGVDSNSRSRWLSAEGADRRDFPFSAWETYRDQRRSAVPEKDRAACRETSNVCICPEKEPAGTCVVRASKAGANHVAIRDRVEGRSHGGVGDVRDGSRIRSRQDAREIRSRAAGAELRGP
jgi:hypothetical protein